MGRYGKLRQRLYNAINARPDKKQLANLAGCNKRETARVIQKVFTKKFQSLTYKDIPNTIPKHQWSARELGLEDAWGDPTRAPILRLISKHKGPGPDNLVDELIFEDAFYRNYVFNKIIHIFNKGGTIEESTLKGKLMLLNKDKEKLEPNITEVRPIVIMNTEKKAIEAVVSWLTES